MKAETLFEKLFFTTVRLETTMADGEKGAGTGFIYSITVGAGRVVQLLVTNKHVVEGAAEVVFWFIAAEDPGMERPKLGHTHCVRIGDPGSLFTGHPEPNIDIAVAPVSPAIASLREQDHHCFFRALTPALALSDEDGEILDALEQVTFLGYPSGLYDGANGMPIARRGITATPPLVDYGGEPVFLIDASVFPGSSGSPVLVADAGTFAVRGQNRSGQRLVLLGVVAAAFQREVPVSKPRT